MYAGESLPRAAGGQWAPRLSQGTSCCSVLVFVELWGALGRECIVKSVMRFLSFFFLSWEYKLLYNVVFSFYCTTK